MSVRLSVTGSVVCSFASLVSANRSDIRPLSVGSFVRPSVQWSVRPFVCSLRLTVYPSVRLLCVRPIVRCFVGLLVRLASCLLVRSSCTLVGRLVGWSTGRPVSGQSIGQLIGQLVGQSVG